MTIQEKLLNIQTELKAPKGQYNSFGKYKYRSCEDILESVKPLLKKHEVVLYLFDNLENIGERYYIKATAVLQDLEGNEIKNTAYAREEDTKKGMDGSQITGTASSYARKYALNGLFCIDDTKDADTDEYSKQTAKPMTIADAKDMIITFGKKHPNEKISDIFKKDKSYLDWLLENDKTDETVKQAIKLVYADNNVKILTDEEKSLKLDLMGKLGDIMIKQEIDREKLLEHYKVKSDADMTIEQLKEAIEKLERKGN